MPMSWPRLIEIDLRFNGVASKVRTQVQQPLMGLRT